MESTVNNILLIQLGDIGDVVLTTPTIRAVKEAHPGARVSIMVRKPYGNLLSADPHLHEVVEFAKIRGKFFHVLREQARFARRLWRSRYDLVIDLRTGDRGAILSFLTGARERVGRHGKGKQFWHDLLFTKVIHDPEAASLPVHPGADQSLRVVRSVGIDTTDSAPRLYVSHNDQDRATALLAACGLPAGEGWVSINPCSRWKYKEWEYARWGEVIDRIWREHRLPTVLVGAPEEVPAAEAIARGRESNVFILTGKTTLGGLAAVLRLSTLHLGVDSAAPHIAAAVGTPTLTLFGPGNWRSWTVADALHRVVTVDMPCVPCNRKGCDDTEQSRCLDGLGAGAVLEEVRDLLGNIGTAKR